MCNRVSFDEFVTILRKWYGDRGGRWMRSSDEDQYSDYLTGRYDYDIASSDFELSFSWYAGFCMDLRAAEDRLKKIELLQEALDV